MIYQNQKQKQFGTLKEFDILLRNHKVKKTWTRVRKDIKNISPINNNEA